MTIKEDLLEILVCPKCHQKVILTDEGSGLDCTACRVRYPILDDIPVMLIEEAVPLS
jgi:uncharacterized protein